MNHDNTALSLTERIQAATEHLLDCQVLARLIDGPDNFPEIEFNPEHPCLKEVFDFAKAEGMSVWVQEFISQQVGEHDPKRIRVTLRDIFIDPRNDRKPADQNYMYIESIDIG